MGNEINRTRPSSSHARVEFSFSTKFTALHAWRHAGNSQAWGGARATVPLGRPVGHADGAGRGRVQGWQG
jgi:hypothetical protein